MLLCHTRQYPYIQANKKVLNYILEGGVGNVLEGCVNEEAVTPDIRGRVQARGQQPASGKSESGIRYTWTHCHAIPDNMPFRCKSTCDDVERRAFYNIKVSVSVEGGFNASQIC